MNYLAINERGWVGYKELSIISLVFTFKLLKIGFLQLTQSVYGYQVRSLHIGKQGVKWKRLHENNYFLWKSTLQEGGGGTSL